MEERTANVEHNNNDTKSKFDKLSIPEMLKKLDEMYDKEDYLLKEMKTLRLQYDQLQDDKELLQTLIMFQSNRLARHRRFGLKDV